MKTVRRISQICFLAIFVVLFFQTNRSIDWTDGSMSVSSWGSADFFMRIDPLLGWTAILSAGSFLLNVALWTVPVLVVTLLFGRAFCGWICPLGTCIDGADRLVRQKKVRRTDREMSWPKLKYYVLAGLLFTALFGSQLVWIVDPMTLLFRSLTLGVFGPLQWAVQSVSGIPILGGIAGQALDLFPERQAVYGSSFAALLMLAGILMGGYFARRFWCRSLCPLGAMLGVLSRLCLFGRRVAPGCNECTVCGIDCKMDAIGKEGRSTNVSECIFCYACADLCREEAVSLVKTRKAGQNLPLDIDRRRLLAGVGLGALWGLTSKAAVAGRPTRDGSSSITGTHLIRPPGSTEEGVFTERCARCGACMKVCPTNGLQPAVTVAGLGGIWTPVLVPRIGECSQNCNLCGKVCPTEAIEPFEIKEKEHLFIGRAVINRSTCVVWESNRQCLVCDEVCSYSAIYWLDESGKEAHPEAAAGRDTAVNSVNSGMPYVDSARCVGCGICEYNCPAGGPDAAIRVTCDGDKRHLSREQQKAWQRDNWVEREGKPSIS